jgi:hypothetical protein
VTTLIQRMREELVRRNYAATTIQSYLKAVEHFQEYINAPLGCALRPTYSRKYAFFLPVDVLGSVFRAKFVDGLRMAYQQGELVFPGSIAELENTRDRRHLHLPLSSLQCRDADWPKSLRPAVGRPVQAAGQFVNHANRRDPIPCPQARMHSCLCAMRDSLSPRSHPVLNAFSTECQPLGTHPTQPSPPLSGSTYPYDRSQNPKNTLAAP